MTHTNFAIRTYGKSEFALLMFPTIDDPKVAQAKLLRWIKKDRFCLNLQIKEKKNRTY